MADDAASSDQADKQKRAIYCVRAAAGIVSEGLADQARAFLTLAAHHDIATVRGLLPLLPGPARAMAAQAVISHGVRGGEIGRPCALLGRAGPTLAAATEALVRNLFDHHQAAFETGTAPRPRHADLYRHAGDVYADPQRPARILMVIETRVNSSPLYMETEFLYHFSRTASRAGMSVRVFEAGVLLYDRPGQVSDEQIVDARRRLDDEVAAFAPDIILLEANFVPTTRTLDPSWVEAVRQARGCKVVPFLGDCYDNVPNFFRFWAPVSDLMIVFNQETTYPLFSGHFEKTFLACSLPFDEPTFAASESDKNLDMLIVGTSHRSRADFAMMLEAHGVPLHNRLHMRLAAEAPTIPDYADLMRRSRLTFNTGRVEENRDLTIMTGRSVEAILSRTVLLEEAGGPIDSFFLPFVHYVPFANAHQLVIFSQFLLAHPDYRQRLAEQALAWHQEHFNSARFWGALLQRLGLPVVASH